MSLPDLPDHGTSGRPTRAAEAFFGRRKAKKLKPAQALLFETLLPALMLDIGRPAPGGLAELFPGRKSDFRLEIGFGSGEHLAHAAKSFPDTGFIGAEPFVNGVGKALSYIEDEKLQNIRIYDQDATRLLEWIPAASLSRVDLFYPDPWPKKRHWKRRFVSPGNLERIARVLKPGGEFRFASDIPHYVNWTLSLVSRRNDLRWTACRRDDWRLPWEGWIRTRYEEKALREGRVPAYLRFRRAD